MIGGSIELAFLFQSVKHPAMRSPFTTGHIVKPIALLLLPGAAICLLAVTSHARVSLEALRRDGYGMVELERPEPNMLTVAATINGRKARLIIDTGWADEGITVKGDFGKVLHSPVQALRPSGRSVSG